MKFNIVTLGCKVNTYESEVIKENLIKHNYQYEENEENADILIINTCSVTNMADHKSQKMVRHAKFLNKILVVCGCSSENNQATYQEMGIDILIGNKDKSKIYERIEEYLKTKKKYQKFYEEESYSFESMQVSLFDSHTRAFVKIEDGCNNYCSYCIIPYVRKNVRSKDFEEAVEEISTLVKNGHKEIVLTGILTGSYNSQGHDLADLIEEISKIEGLERIRISSIEVTELNEKMLEVIKNNKKVVNHFHIPLQAGSDEILKRMNRKYDLDAFKKKIEEIRFLKPDVSITTDVIVGHPYETEELFLKTMETCKELKFAKIHVFPYSKRDGTPSSRMPMQVNDSEKKFRSRTLNALSKELEENFHLKHLNKELEVLIEETTDFESTGFTTNYIKVKINENLKRNEIYKVKIKEMKNGFLIGECIKEEVNL